MRNIVLFILFSIAIQGVNAQTPRFVMDKTDTFFCETATITFTNSSVPAPGFDLSAYTFKWNFKKPLITSTKDTIPAYKASVRMTYNRPAKHYITLEMIRDGVSTVYTDSIYIRPKPNAWFTVADTVVGSDSVYRFISGKSLVKNDTINYKYTWTLMQRGGEVTSDSKDITFVSKATKVHNSPAFASKDGFKRDLLLENISDEGYYKMNLLVEDWRGCKDVYNELFYASKKLHFPQAFTPNGDGDNDFFRVQTNGRDVFNFQVFNSHGVLVFKSESNSILWDGYDINGKMALSGVYYFIVQSVQSDKPVKEVGYVVLLSNTK